MGPRPLALLYAIFFASGAAALIFEALWFHQAGLAFGNSVWASALVLSSFMAGMGVGNGLAARYGHRVRHPIRCYAALECIVAGFGFALVLALPEMAHLVSRMLAPLTGSGWPLQVARFSVGFVVLLAPAVAMGATLPVLVETMIREGRDFGGVLGRLYGINTLGAVLGAASAELVLIPALGIRGTGLFAMGVLAVAVLVTLAIARREGETTTTPPRSVEPRVRLDLRSIALLGAAFLSGAILMGLEVLWFRLLQLFTPPTTEAFALMLATVLGGIGVGGLLGALWLRVRPAASDATAVVALLAGALAIHTYRVFPEAQAQLEGSPIRLLPLFAELTFPTSLLSGVLFALLGHALHRRLGSGARPAGLVALANTVGSMIGPLVAGFLMIPVLTLEPSFLVLSAGYSIVAAFALFGVRQGTATGIPRPVAHVVGAIVLGWMAFGFPRGSTSELYAKVFSGAFANAERLVSVLEESNQIIAYVRRDFAGEPQYYRLSTDSYSMSSSSVYSRRYMAPFAILPIAFHPAPRDALLISYGVGITAKALTDEERLERIDVVDISRGILRLGQVVFPEEEHPLRDPRVRVHVEDGRHFLAATEQRYDVITAEPPPPAAAGIVNLYTQEYFEILRSRLREHGAVSYWLPVVQLTPTEAKSITGAFCSAFPNCSVWAPTKDDWILLGTRGEGPRMSEDAIRHPWTDPRRVGRLREIGLEHPEQLAALFVADATTLVDWAEGVPPLTDNWPYRAPRWRLIRELDAEYVGMLEASRRRFQQSEWIASRWPGEFRRAGLDSFDGVSLGRAVIERAMHGVGLPIGVVDRVLRETDLVTLPHWLLGTDADRQRIARRAAERGDPSREVAYEVALGALAERDYAAAADWMAEVPQRRRFPLRNQIRLYALCMAGRSEIAKREALSLREDRDTPKSFWALMEQEFGVSPGQLPTTAPL